MQLVSKCKGVAYVCKISHHIGQVLKILMFSFKTCGPVVDERPVPGKKKTGVSMDKKEASKTVCEQRGKSMYYVCLCGMILGR